ncbi:MAG TPA: hypothetical protein VK992_03300, partial [Candidatus Caenarcaniphilales bacterium]|nr:hypothetical protein [Candidatus Caenarcaniphilales bacterium]
HNRPIDSALIRFDKVLATGDAIAPIGAANVARVAAAAGVAVYGVGATSSIDLATTVRSRYADEFAQPADVAFGSSQTRLEPLTDFVPAELVGALMTEEGVIGPPYETTLAEAVERRATRREAEQMAGTPV